MKDDNYPGVWVGGLQVWCFSLRWLGAVGTEPISRDVEIEVPMDFLCRDVVGGMSGAHGGTIGWR